MTAVSATVNGLRQTIRLVSEKLCVEGITTRWGALTQAPPHFSDRGIRQGREAGGFAMGVLPAVVLYGLAGAIPHGGDPDCFPLVSWDRDVWRSVDVESGWRLPEAAASCQATKVSPPLAVGFGASSSRTRFFDFTRTAGKGCNQWLPIVRFVVFSHGEMGEKGVLDGEELGGKAKIVFGITALLIRRGLGGRNEDFEVNRNYTRRGTAFTESMSRTGQNPMRPGKKMT